MSRLENYQKKQTTKNLFISFFIFLIIIVFIFTYGIKLLLNFSSFIARITENKSKTTSLLKNQNFIGNIDIDSIPTATNSSKIIVGGSVVNFNKLEFYLNGEPVKETPLSSSDIFEEEIGELKSGQNEVFIIAKFTSEEQEKKSKVFNVVFKSEKPKLEIKEPQDNLKSLKQEIQIAGSTDKEIYIRVNDLPVVVDAQGNFQTFLKLKEGENKISITAQDTAGNIEAKTLTVTYQKDE